MAEKAGNRKVTIIGAGFSGLSSAFHLHRAGFNVEIFEESAQAGGLISTIRTQEGLVETAANGLLNSLSVEELFHALGLEITPARKEARRRFIFRSGLPRRWPCGISGTLSVLKFLFLYFVNRKSISPKPLETVRSWGHRVLGVEATTYLVEAALQGIYAGDASRLSASLIFGRMFLKPSHSQKQKRPEIRGTVSAPEGMGQLALRLREYLEFKGVQFHFSEKASETVLRGSAQHPVIIATSAPAAAELLASVDPERSLALRKIELLPIVTATVFFKHAAPRGQGFGCLFPPSESKPQLGVLRNELIFPNRVRGVSSENWIFGGSSADASKITSASDENLLKLIARERELCFGSDASAPLSSVITRWPKALPHYTTGLEALLAVIKQPRDNVFLIGNYLGEIGLARILDRARELPDLLNEQGSWL